MLNKDICKKCRNNDNRIKWNDIDEERWNKYKFVTCYYSMGYIVDITDLPSNDCPYYFEHLILGS